MNCLGKNGTCKNQPIKGSTYCFWHDPEKTKERLLAQAKGGYRRKTPKAVAEYPGEIASVADVVDWCNALLLDGWEQENSDKRTRSISSVLRIALEALQIGNIENRLSAIENALAKLENK